MSKILIKVDEHHVFRRNYQHIAVENLLSSTEINSRFVNSLSSFKLHSLSMECFQIYRDTFIRCISGFGNLKELRLDSIKCIDDGIIDEYEKLETPKLKSLVLHNCNYSASLLKALNLLNIQSHEIEFSYDKDMKHLYRALIAQQNGMKSLIVINASRGETEFLMKNVKGTPDCDYY